MGGWRNAALPLVGVVRARLTAGQSSSGCGGRMRGWGGSTQRLRLRKTEEERRRERAHVEMASRSVLDSRNQAT